MIMGGYYYRSQMFSIGDFSRPEIALETATRAAHILDGGDKNPEQRLSLRARIRPVYNDAGTIIGYNVHSRHWVGTVDDAKPDKGRDGEYQRVVDDERPKRPTKADGAPTGYSM